MRHESPRPEWPAHYDEGVWYCDAHDRYACALCAAGLGAGPAPAQPPQERRALGLPWGVIDADGDLVSLTYYTRAGAEERQRTWNSQGDGRCPHRVARLVLYEATTAEIEAEADPPEGSEP